MKSPAQRFGPTSFVGGTSIPQIGFGVYRVPTDEAEVVVAQALEAGYRSIDMAKLYDNEAGVGRAIAESGITRDEHPDGFGA